MDDRHIAVSNASWWIRSPGNWCDLPFASTLGGVLESIHFAPWTAADPRNGPP
ncbi:hypothetical protein [Rhodococcus sp. 06-235-1A]|uniref:hypothetical protein n=1 Tax=Rhodococcus sp. 06-235-1A TaxID=2022508 RepID=UPI00211B4FA3|nr:hypothetical protein [Rhodococcus sp. 06-235-1A]